MRKYDKYKRLIKMASSATIVGLEILIYACFWYGYFDKVMAAPFWRKGNWVIVAIYGLQTLFFSKMYGAFRVGYSKVLDVILSQILSLFCVNLITYLQIALIERRFAHEEQLVIMTVVEIFIVVSWSVVFHGIYKRMFPPRQMLLVHGRRSSFELESKINERKDKYKICKAIDVENGYEEFFESAKLYDAVIIGDIPAAERNALLKYCFKESIRAYTLPKISDVFLRGADEIDLFDTPLLLCRNNGLSIDQKFVKRILDIIISLVGIFLTAPLMLVVAILIKLYDRGAIIYKQERYTIDKKRFYVYKFRSMVTGAESDGVVRLAEQNDDRVTPIGKILRRTRIDELPQFFNILKGEMAVVGPRPERPEIADQYEVEIPEFEFRVKVKGGLTGYAQIYGKYNTTPYDKLKLDLKYISEYSLLLDLKMIIKTFKVLFVKESTDGISGDQTTALKNCQRLENEENRNE